MYSIKDLHYGFRRRADKIESLQNRNFYVEQIDDYLNEAVKIFVTELAKELETTQDVTDDLRQLFEYDIALPVTSFDKYVTAQLPNNYFRLIKSYSIASNANCDVSRRLKHYAVQSDDVENLLTDVFYKPSFSWGETAYRLVKDKIMVYTNNEFTIQSVVIDFLSKHPRLGNPEDSRNGTYTLPNGTIAAQQDLILDSTNQPEKIMDIAVMLAYMDIADPNYQIKLNKILNVYK